MAEESILDDLDRWILRPVFLPRPGIFPIFTPIKQVNMDITRIKSALQFAAPVELYDIEPGQVVFFVPKEGLDQITARLISEIFVYFRRLYRDNDVKISITPTDNELLIDTIAGRNPNEVGIPYEVVVSTRETIAGFASQYFGEDVQAIVDRVPKDPLASRLRISATNLPAIVEIDPDNRPAKVQRKSVEQRIESSYQSGFDLGMKIAKPEKGSLAEKELIAKEEKKLEKILRECAVLGIENEIDIDKIKKKVEEDLKKKADYQLILKTEKVKLATGASSNRYNPYRLSVCDIYVADRDDCKLDFTALQTAIYLSFLFYKDGLGVSVADSYDGLRQIALKIYSCLPGYEKTRKSNTFLDDSNALYSYMNSLRSYFTHIREEIYDKVLDPAIAEKFCIEGFNNSPYGIEMSSPEIRAQIKETFGL